MWQAQEQHETESVTVNQEWGSGTWGDGTDGEIKMNFTQLKTNIQNFIEDDSTGT